jgi:hypothetical protein
LAGRQLPQTRILQRWLFCNGSAFSVNRAARLVQRAHRVSRKDVVRAMIYQRRMEKRVSPEASKHYWNCTSVQTFVNTSLDNNPLLGLSENLIARGYGLTLLLGCWWRSGVPRYSNNPMGSKLQMATLIRNVCLKQRNGLAQR